MREKYLTLSWRDRWDRCKETLSDYLPTIFMTVSLVAIVAIMLGIISQSQ